MLHGCIATHCLNCFVHEWYRGLWCNGFFMSSAGTYYTHVIALRWVEKKVSGYTHARAVLLPPSCYGQVCHIIVSLAPVHFASML